MIHRSHSIAAVRLVAALMFLFTASVATAQVPWGGCPNTTIRNFTGCKLVLAMNMVPVASPAYTLQPGQILVVPTGGVASINSVVSAGGFLYPVLPPPPVAPCSCPAGSWSVCCVSLPSGMICCCDVCFDPVTCTITILPSVCPPATCRP